MRPRRPVDRSLQSGWDRSGRRTEVCSPDAAAAAGGRARSEPVQHTAPPACAVEVQRLRGGVHEIFRISAAQKTCIFLCTLL